MHLLTIDRVALERQRGTGECISGLADAELCEPISVDAGKPGELIVGGGGGGGDGGRRRCGAGDRREGVGLYVEKCMPRLSERLRNSFSSRFC